MTEKVENLKLGVAGGLFLATCYSAWAILVFLSAGPAASDGPSLLEIVAAYYLGGISGGLLIGLMLPLRRSLLGALVVGYVVAVPFFLLATLITVRHEIEDGQERLLATCVIAGIGSLAGAAVSAWFWYQDR